MADGEANGRRARGWRAMVVGVVAVAAACVAGQIPSGQGDDDRLRALINGSRHERGLAPLLPSAVLDTAARDHAEKMSRRQDLFHRTSRDFRRLKVEWLRVGENVGTAGDVDEMHRLMMASPLHRANVLGPFTSVGIGIVHDRRNRLWVTELFIAQ